MKRILSAPSLVTLLFLLLPTLAQAHTGVGHTDSLSHGFLHPIGGLDHLLAMLAVGLWAAQLGGRALWAVPTTFVSIMVLGGVLGITGAGLPFVEQGIVGSVLILGVLIAAAVRLPLAASMGLVGLFALFHGFAHGSEMAAGSSALSYSMGFVLATSLLHLTGIGLGMIIQKAARPVLVRWAGGAVAVAGLYLMVG